VKARLWDATTAPRHGLNRFGLCDCAICSQLSAKCCEACIERAARWTTVPDPPPVVRLELIDRDSPTCRKPGCENVLTGRQTMFCSKTCGGAVRQARFRDRDLLALSATDVDLISQTLGAPKEFRRAVTRAWRNSERALDLGSGVTCDPQVLEVFREAARR
jgi:hypothetical protein